MVVQAADDLLDGGIGVFVEALELDAGNGHNICTRKMQVEQVVGGIPTKQTGVVTGMPFASQHLLESWGIGEHASNFSEDGAVRWGSPRRLPSNSTETPDKRMSCTDPKNSDRNLL